MRRAVFIPVRVGSTRLSRKALIEIKGQSMIEHLIDRVKTAELPERIVLCTTTLPEDSPLVQIASIKQISCFRGSEEDIISRYAAAIQAFGFQQIVNVDGDDIFCEPWLIDKAFKELEESGADFVSFEGLPIGASPIGFTATALQRVYNLKRETRSDTGWGRFFTETGLFRTRKIPPECGLVCEGLRLTLDYPEDLEFAKVIFDALYEPGKVVTVEEIIRYVKDKPEVLAVNSGLKEEYETTFARKQVSLALRRDESSNAEGRHG
jgi:spore coat polysaccharide biosynthesis protein SpsF